MDTIDCVVVGAGVLGLAIARELGRAGRETLVLERHDHVGAETSSRNSEVIHGGLYYPSNSLKALTCVRGRELLYAFCERRGVPHRRCGKLIVATDPTQLPELERIADGARFCGVDNLEFMHKSAAQSLEPALRCVGALNSPSTGIIDAHALMLALLGEAEADGVAIVRRCAVTRLALVSRAIEIRIENDNGAPLRARWLINAAGLGAVALADCFDGFPQAHVPEIYLAKGSYFAFSGRAPFSRLVYPIPERGGLGIHMTLDLAGRARFGPDVEWVSELDFTVEDYRSRAFYPAVRRYFPALPDGALEPAYAGIRPKLSGPGEPAADFRIDGPADHDVPGVVNLFGIESPGLTAALAIAERVAKIVTDSLSRDD